MSSLLCATSLLRPFLVLERHADVSSFKLSFCAPKQLGKHVKEDGHADGRQGTTAKSWKTIVHHLGGEGGGEDVGRRELSGPARCGSSS